MTPGARISAAIAVIDRIEAGVAAEKALLEWSRGARYAGSKDRAAVRDHVFDALRCWRSAAAAGGGTGGRARMLGLLRVQGASPEAMFTGDGHAPDPLTDAERHAGRAPEGAEAADLPDWLWDRFCADLGTAAAAVARALRHRAPVFLRVNPLRGTADAARASLSGDGIVTEPAPRAAGALRVIEGARRVARSAAYEGGLVELQDAASQAVVEALPLRPGMRVLDYCAGGGGKALAMAARLGGGPVVAHDALPDRMRDLPVRARRAGAEIRVAPHPQGRFDLVLCDVPCSGSGTWRRAPEAKWRLNEAGLAALTATQVEILAEASAHVEPGGALAYVTCSVLAAENDAPVAAFRAAHPGWTSETTLTFLPDADGDGLALRVLRAPAP